MSLRKKNIIFSVIILTYNEERTINQLLNHLISSIREYSFEIIIIDSESVDQTPIIVKQLKRKCPYIRYYNIKKSGFNFGKIRNWSVSLAKGSFILFLSADTLIRTKNIFDYLLEDFSINNDVVAVFGQQIPHKNLNIIYQLDLICQFTTLNQYINKNGIVIQSLKNPFIEYNKKNEHCWYFISNVFACYKKKFLQECPFRESPLAEDIILGKEIIKKGLTKIYDSRCRIIHYHKKSLVDYYINQKKTYSIKFSEIKLKPQSNFFCKCFILFNMDIGILKKLLYFTQLMISYFLKLLIYMYVRFNNDKRL